VEVGQHQGGERRRQQAIVGSATHIRLLNYAPRPVALDLRAAAGLDGDRGRIAVAAKIAILTSAPGGVSASRGM
jgi:hypothetical protein